jgi:hypothetical protein
MATGDFTVNDNRLLCLIERLEGDARWLRLISSRFGLTEGTEVVAVARRIEQTVRILNSTVALEEQVEALKTEVETLVLTRRREDV